MSKPVQDYAGKPTRGVRGGAERGPLSQIMAFSRLSTPLYGRISDIPCTPGSCRNLHGHANRGGRA